MATPEGDAAVEHVHHRFGTAHEPTMVKRTRFDHPDLEVVFGTADIHQPTEWTIEDSRPAAIVHLSGHMELLETELDGHGGSSGPALPGEVWTVPSRRRYRSHAQGETISYAALYFNTHADSRAVGEIRGVAGARDSRLFQAVQTLSRAVSGKADVDGLATESTIEMICRHMRLLYAENPRNVVARPIPALDAEQSRRVREYILDSLSERIRLEDVAELVGVTSHRLLIAFRKSFGTTPAQYVIEQRVRAAQRLLLHSSDDIASIALKCGLYSHSHLTTLFQQRVGCSPSEFRRMHKT